MLVRDMLEEPLRLRLRHADPTALDRAVSRICVTDMPDPLPFVTPGALVCTGLVWRRDADDSAHYIGLLATAGAVAVAAGQSLYGHVPDDVVTACERHGLPLLEVPESLPFSRIIEHLAGRNAESRLRRVKSGLARQRRLLAAVADGRDIEALVDEFARDCGVRAWLLTSTGAVVAGAAALDDDVIDHVITAAATAYRLPLTLRDGYAVWPVGGRLGDRIAVWYLVVRDLHGDLEPDGAAADLAAVAELYRMRRAEQLRLSWEMTDRVRAEPPPGPVTAVVVDVVRPPGSAVARELPREHDAVTKEDGPVHDPVVAGRDTWRALLHDVLPAAHTTVDPMGRVVAWVSGGEHEIAAILRRRLDRLTPVLSGAVLRAGVSVCRAGESTSGAVAAAVAAASVGGDSAVSVRVADVDSAVGLLTAVPDELQRRFAERVLGPVVDYDRRTGAGLLETLEIFLGCAGSWRQAADRMHLHLNTVRYRIGRVEELTGRDLGRLDDRLDLFLAVRARSGPAASPDPLARLRDPAAESGSPRVR
ncbi:helix-turn-helix domain-containing protein [Nocardia sp. alder85J]|uniref:helix-turn-helix domain-containing protein n=1 Tax=Nocardia sp. alder85J TaxID=2862949 RepID=UPI001CD4893C|nr:PucR family transcriptional regulator [Nocardia sp. alder85J]MCX4095362.1 helix-turn-helix domain-containing protein [Nocardia sp. alder85J]